MLKMQNFNTVSFDGIVIFYILLNFSRTDLYCLHVLVLFVSQIFIFLHIKKLFINTFKNMKNQKYIKKLLKIQQQ